MGREIGSGAKHRLVSAINLNRVDYRLIYQEIADFKTAGERKQFLCWSYILELFLKW